MSITGDFRGPLLSRRQGDWRSWQGQLYADMPRVDVQQLRQYVQLGVDVSQARGALRGWITLDKSLVRASTVDIALADVDVRLRSDLTPLEMKALSGRYNLMLDDSNLPNGVCNSTPPDRSLP